MVRYTGPSEAASAPQSRCCVFSALHQSEHQLRDDDQENGKLEELRSIGLRFGVQHLVSLSENRQLALDPATPGGRAEEIERRRVKACKIDIIGHLQCVLGALYGFSYIRNTRLKLAEHGLKMGQFAPAVRVVVCGRAQTPSLDAVLALFVRETVVARLRAAA